MRVATMEIIPTVGRFTRMFRKSKILLITAGLSTVAAWSGAEAPATEAADEGPVLRLGEAVHRALEHNLSLGIARLEPQIAADAEVIEEAVFDFSLFGTADYTRRDRPVATDVTEGTETTTRRYSFGARQPFSTGTIVTAETALVERDTNAEQAIGTRDAEFALGLNQSLWRGFGREVNLAQLRRARIGTETERLRFRNAILDVLAQTETAYWDLAYAYRDRELRESSIRVAESLLEETRERERLGLATRLDVLQARANLAERQEDILFAQQELEAAHDRLLILLGALDESLALDATSRVSALPEEFAEPPEFSTVWRRTLDQNPDTLVQEAVVEQRRLDRVVARDRTRPTVDLSAGVGVLGVDIDDRWSAYDSALNKDGHFWRVGVQFNMPWGFAAERAQLRQAGRRLEQEEIRLFDIKQRLLEQTRRAWRQLRTSEERLSAASLTLELQEESFEQERSRFETGLSTFRAVLESQRDLDNARNSRLRAVIERIRAEVDLHRIDGTLLERHGFAWDEVEVP